MQSVVLVLEQLFHRKHGGSEHIHLKNTEKCNDLPNPRTFFQGRAGGLLTVPCERSFTS